MVNLILEGNLLIPPESAPPLICEILHGCWQIQPIDRLTFQEIDYQLMDDQRARRSHKIIQDNVMRNYIIPFPVADSTASRIRMDNNEQSTAVIFTEAHQAIASISTISTSIDPYLELITPHSHEDNSLFIHSYPMSIITSDEII